MPVFLVTVFGLMVGSFLNVCIHRIPRGASVIRPRSQCPQCRHQLKAWENIPLISFLILKGRCSACNTRISWRYPSVEALTAVLFVTLYQLFGLSLEWVVFTFFLCIVVVITFIDIEHQLIPNRLLLWGLLPGVYPLIRDGFQRPQLYLFGALGLGLGFLLIGVLGNLVFRKESLGMGDVKYAALIGLILGWQDGLVASAVAFLSALVLFLFLMPFGKVSFGQRIPFGPFLSLGTLLALLWGPHLIQWYLSLVF